MDTLNLFWLLTEGYKTSQGILCVMHDFQFELNVTFILEELGYIKAYNELVRWTILGNSAAILLYSSGPKTTHI